MEKMVSEEEALVCFLEKKMFYTTGLQRRLKHLPQGPHKPEVINGVKRPRALSCRFSVKVMFMGVAVKPLPELGFYGRILLRRISERKVCKKTSYNQGFSDNSILNSEIMGEIGGWREIIHNNTLTFYGLAEQLDNYCNLDDFVSDCLTFTYVSYVERGGDNKIKFLSGDGRIEDHWVKGNIPTSRRELNLSDLEL